MLRCATFVDILLCVMEPVTNVLIVEIQWDVVNSDHHDHDDDRDRPADPLNNLVLD